MNGEVPEKVMGQPAKLDHAGESPALSSIERRLKAMQEKGWMVTFVMDWFGSYEVSGYAGDCNCPRRKEYDRSDGHGCSSFETDANVEINSFGAALDYAEWRIEQIVPGAPY